MPFQSEKQRRYLWANEPEIARDWTDTYGSRISKDDGGIMHQFENYAHDNGNNVSVPRSFQARPHSEQVNLAYITPQEEGILQALKPGTPHRGPMEIPNYDAFDAQGNYATSQQHDAPTAGDVAAGVGSTTGGGAGDTRIATIKQDIRDVGRGTRPAGYNVGQFQPSHRLNQRGWQKFNPLRLLGGFFGNVGRGISGIMGLGSDWASNMRGGMTQQEWEQAKQERIANKRIQNILGRKAPITEMTQKNLAGLGYTGEMPGIGSTGTSRAIDKDYTMQDTLREYPITTNRIQDIQRGWNNAGITGTQAYEDFSPNVALSKLLANPDQLYEEFRTDKPVDKYAWDISTDDLINQGKGPRITNILFTDEQKKKAEKELKWGVEPKDIMPKLQQQDPFLDWSGEKSIKANEFISWLETEKGMQLTEDQKREIYEAAGQEMEDSI